MRKSRYFYTKIHSSFLLVIKLVYVAKILYLLYNKKSSIFYFVQQFHKITIALIHSSEKKIKPALSIKAGLYCFI